MGWDGWVKRLGMDQFFFFFFFFAISQKSQNNPQYSDASMQCRLHRAQPPPNGISFTQQRCCHLHPVMLPPSSAVSTQQCLNPTM
jgi:hypothetical protein